MRILVTGSRHWTDREVIESALSKATGEHPERHTLIHGNAKGADTLAAETVWSWVKKWGGWDIEAFPANWTKHGRAAGPIRNAQMLTKGKPDLVLAFPLPGSVGTWDMIRKANAAGVEVRIVPSRR